MSSWCKPREGIYLLGQVPADGLMVRALQICGREGKTFSGSYVQNAKRLQTHGSQTEIHAFDTAIEKSSMSILLV